MQVVTDASAIRHLCQMSFDRHCILQSHVLEVGRHDVCLERCFFFDQKSRAYMHAHCSTCDNLILL